MLAFHSHRAILSTLLLALATSATGIAALGSTPALTNANGIATKVLTVGPLAAGQSATISACVKGTSQCVANTAFGARPEYAFLQLIAGTAQTLAVTLSPLTLPGVSTALTALGASGDTSTVQITIQQHP